MSTITTRELDRGMQAFLDLLERAKKLTPPPFDRARLEEVRKEVEELRLAALEAEIRAEYPNAKLSRRLLSLIGTEPDLPLEEEQQAIIEAVAGEER